MNSQHEMSILIPPWGNRLADLMVAGGQVEELKAYANTLPSIHLSERSSCDLELLSVGAFSPLDRFMTEADYRCVLDDMRLTSGDIFPIPITLSIDPHGDIGLDQEIALRNSKNELLAVMAVEEMYQWDFREAANKVFCTEDLRHPLVAGMYRWSRTNVSGSLQMLQLPTHHDYIDLRLTPAQTRTRLESFGCHNVVAFQPSSPVHPFHQEMIEHVAADMDGALLVHPVVGMVKPGDVDHYTSVRAFEALNNTLNQRSRSLLALLPLATRMAGPREALWHAIIQRNYGANYLVIGQDHAGAGLDSKDKAFYGPDGAHELVERFSDEVGVGVVRFQEPAGLPQEERNGRFAAALQGSGINSTSRKAALEDSNKAKSLPEWSAPPETAESKPARQSQGVCVWFTGLSGAGKSTTADILTVLLMESGRQVTVLDGDVVRTHLSQGLGFSREDRDINVRRIGFVASEIVRHGGVAVCAAVSPYIASRNQVRSMVGGDCFIEVYVDTPLAVCEERDSKGMYAKARRGEIKGFTGIDDPYEPPVHAELNLDTVNYTAEDNARLILDHLIEKGLVNP